MQVDDNSISEPAVNSVICLVEHEDIFRSIRLPIDSTLISLKEFICESYHGVKMQSLHVWSIREGKKVDIESDYVFQSIMCHTLLHKDTYLFLGFSENIIKDLGACSVATSSSCSGIYSESGSEVFIGLTSVAILHSVGQRFSSVEDFRIDLLKHSMMNGYEIKMIHNDPHKVSAHCKLKDSNHCGWRVYAVLEFPHSETFVIRTFNPNHTCGAAFVNIEKFTVSSKLVKSIVVDVVRDRPEMTSREVIDLFRQRFHVDLSYYYAHTGLELALKDIHGDDALSYHQLDWYVSELKKANPGSCIFLEKHTNTCRFERLFVAFRASIEGFKHCRPFVALDGTFCKGKFKGCVLAATGLNGDSGIFQIAFAVVCSENKDNWLWFMDHLKGVIPLDRKYTFISDRHAGLLASVPNSFPDSYHSFCLYHLKINFSALLGDRKKLKVAILHNFEELGKSPTIMEYEERRQKLLTVGGKKAEDFLTGVPVDRFVNAFFPGERYGYVCSNIAESYNNWISKERNLPVTAMVDKIRMKTMRMFSERRDACKKWTTHLCPLKEALLSKRLGEGTSMIAIKCNDEKYEIRNELIHVVNLRARTCTCNIWRIEGFPCAHALRAMKVHKVDVYSYIAPCFFVSTYKKSYEDAIEPVCTAEMPSSLPEEPSIVPPQCNRPVGRPRKKRIPNTGSDEKRSNQCGRCKKYKRHNRRTCTEAIKE